MDGERGVSMKTLTLHRTPDGWLHILPTTNSEPHKIKYDPDAPCICCGLPVTEASMGGTVVCPWCDCGNDRLGNQVILHHGSDNPHPKYLEHYGFTLEEYLEKLNE